MNRLIFIIANLSILFFTVELCLTESVDYGSLLTGGLVSTKSVLFPEDEDPTLVKSWAVIRESDGELVETKDFTEEEARKYSVEHPDMYLVLSLSVR